MYKDKNQREFARQLRNNQTDAERKLWQYLRAKQLYSRKFRRQAAIGKYIVDFVCFELKLVVELDGGQHNETGQREYDAQRSTWLQSQGFEVLRYWNHDVMENVESVVEAIGLVMQRQLQGQPPSPSPSPRGGGE